MIPAKVTTLDYFCAMQTYEIEVFKVGIHTDANGNTREWTDEDIDLIISKYNEQVKSEQYRAPVVIGHPLDNSPAYGWVHELFRKEDSIWAKIEITDDAFLEWVQKGLYRERSIALDPDLVLVHIGFLGGVPPAVKGMEVPKFSGSGAVSYYSLPMQPVAGTDPVAPTQSERAKKYGIDLKENYGSESMPTVYVEQGYDDSDFADPVHYVYPIKSKTDVLASMRLIDVWQLRDKYTTSELAILLARLYHAALAHDVAVSTYYSTASTQFAGITTMPTFFTDFLAWLGTSYGEEVMNQTQAKLEASLQTMFQELLQFITDTFGAEVGAAAQAKWEEMLAAQTPASAGEDEDAVGAGDQADTDDDAVTSATAQHKADPRLTELARRVRALEQEKRTQEHANFCSSLKLGGTQRDQAMRLLENAFQSDSKGVTINAYSQAKEVVKTLTPSVPTGGAHAHERIAFGASGKGAGKRVAENATSESLQIHEQALALSKKDGISYTAAVKQIRSRVTN